MASPGIEVDRRILLTGDNDRDELAWDRVEEPDEFDESESDRPLFAALGAVSIVPLQMTWPVICLLASLSHG